MSEAPASTGYHGVCLALSGDGVTRMRNEAGGHRIQRVPPNERRGRVHTSTVTVAVFDGVDVAVAVARPESEFRVEWFSGGGAGGQHRNKHRNCARIFHIPTGLKQERQGRSRDANYRDAMAALTAMLDERVRSGSKAEEDHDRRQQIGSGMRGDKRRTYRFQDDVVVDHVTGRSNKASKVMKGAMTTLW